MYMILTIISSTYRRKCNLLNHMYGRLKCLCFGASIYNVSVYFFFRSADLSTISTLRRHEKRKLFRCVSNIKKFIWLIRSDQRQKSQSNNHQIFGLFPQAFSILFRLFLDMHFDLQSHFIQFLHGILKVNFPFAIIIQRISVQIVFESAINIKISDCFHFSFWLWLIPCFCGFWWRLGRVINPHTNHTHVDVFMTPVVLLNGLTA